MQSKREFVKFSNRYSFLKLILLIHISKPFGSLRIKAIDSSYSSTLFDSSSKTQVRIHFTHPFFFSHSFHAIAHIIARIWWIYFKESNSLWFFFLSLFYSLIYKLVKSIFLFLRTIYFIFQSRQACFRCFAFLFFMRTSPYLFLFAGSVNEIRLNRNEQIKAIHFTFNVNIEEEISFKLLLLPNES